jgi:hypothetical protein
MIKYTLEAARLDLAGYFCRVKTPAGRVVHGTGYFKTPEEAEQAARDWIKGRRELEAASLGQTPLG